MNKEIDCVVVKDLLPNYIDKLTSKETTQIVEKHLTICADCAKECDEMMGTLNIDKVPKQSNFQIYLNKTKRMYLLKGVILSMGIIGILVSFIVDIAVNRKLTWSLIVDVSMVYIYATVLTAIISKKEKLIKTSVVASILIVPLLYIIEIVVNKNYLLNPINWFKLYALPITLIWLTIIWFIILIRKFLRLNIWNTLGAMLLVTILGSAFTNAIASQVTINAIYYSSLEWIDSLSYLGCAIICFIIGHIKRDKGTI